MINIDLEIVLLCAVIYAVFMQYIIKPIWRKLKDE